MKDFHSKKRIKQLRKLQGLPTVGDIITDLCYGTIFLVALLVIGFVIISI